MDLLLLFYDGIIHVNPIILESPKIVQNILSHDILQKLQIAFLHP